MHQRFQPAFSFSPSHCEMYDLPYSNMTRAEVVTFMTDNHSEPEVHCRHGWTYDTSQYKTSISMDVRCYFLIAYVKNCLEKKCLFHNFSTLKCRRFLLEENKTRLFYIVIIMTTDDLTTHQTRISGVMGLLPDMWNCGLRMRRECRERFPRHRLQRKPLFSDPGMHHGTCVTHVPWCMSGSLTRGGGENDPGIPGACATRNFTYLAKGQRY